MVQPVWIASIVAFAAGIALVLLNQSLFAPPTGIIFAALAFAASAELGMFGGGIRHPIAFIAAGVLVPVAIIGVDVYNWGGLRSAGL